MEMFDSYYWVRDVLLAIEMWDLKPLWRVLYENDVRTYLCTRFLCSALLYFLPFIV